MAGWRAEDYFEEPEIIQLCRAIELNDLAAMERIIKAGADVNAQGKGNMTPLLWAFPDNKLERFKLLLEHSANPNVITEDDFGTRGVFMAGTSVTHLATGTRFPGFCEAVFEHRGDPNLERQTRVLGHGDTPLFILINLPVSDRDKKIRLLIEKGADINHINPGLYSTPSIQAAANKQWDTLLMLLKAGANPKICPNKESTERLVHSVLVVGGNIDFHELWTADTRKEYEAVLDWLNSHGESIEEARADLQRWKSWKTDNGEYQQKMAAEVAERKVRQADAKLRDAPAPENAKP